MISIIIGNKGSGKTKRLISLVNEAVSSSKGNVVCVEKVKKLTYDISHNARLIATDNYSICGFDALYGFLAGICAGNYDVTHVFVDATFRIGGRDYEELVGFFTKLNKVSEESGAEFVFTLSCDESSLPEQVFELTKKL